MSFDLDKTIKDVCERKHVRESQFKDYLNAFGSHMIDREVERFIDYCESDGWKYYRTDVELPK